jgi:hypothetical protein
MLGIDGLKTAHYVCLPSLTQYDIILLGTSSNLTEVLPLQKRMITMIMMAVSSRCSCKGLFTKLDTLPAPCEYIFSVMLFTVNKLDNIQTNAVVHGLV